MARVHNDTNINTNTHTHEKHIGCVVRPAFVAQFVFNRFLTIILFTNKFVIITNNMIILAWCRSIAERVIKMNVLKMSMHWWNSFKMGVRVCLCVNVQNRKMLNHNTCNVEKWSSEAIHWHSMYIDIRTHTLSHANMYIQA